LYTRRNDVKWVATRETSAKTLLVQGATDDAATCQTALRRWLARKGEDHLLPWLKRVSNKTGLSYAVVHEAASLAIHRRAHSPAPASPRRSGLGLVSVSIAIFGFTKLLMLEGNMPWFRCVLGWNPTSKWWLRTPSLESSKSCRCSWTRNTSLSFRRLGLLLSFASQRRLIGHRCS